MTRKEAEKKIITILLEIADIYQEYHPDVKQINLTVTKNHCWAFNAYFERDANHPLDITVRRGKE